MLEEVEAIENLSELVTVPGVDVYFIGSGDLSQSMGYTGQQAHPDVQKVMERGVATITGAGRIAGCSCPDNLIPKFLGLGVQYFHGSVGRLLQQGSTAYLQAVRQAAPARGSDDALAAQAVASMAWAMPPRGAPGSIEPHSAS